MIRKEWVFLKKNTIIVMKKVNNKFAAVEKFTKFKFVVAKTT